MVNGLCPVRGDGNGTGQIVPVLVGGQSQVFIDFGLNSNEVVDADCVICV